MNKNKFSFFTRIANSITYLDFYANVIKEPVSRAVTYLLLFTFLLGLIISIRPALYFNESISLFFNAFEDKVPNFILKNGELNVDGEMPVSLEFPGSIMIIDTSGQTDETILNEYPNGFLFTRNKMFQKTIISRNEFDFKQLGTVTFTKDMMSDWVPFARLFSVFIFIIAPLGFIAARFLTALMLAVIGLILNSSMRMELTFTEIFRLSVYALTLPIATLSLLKAGDLSVPAFGIIYFFMGTVYVWKAMNTIKKKKENIT